MISDVLNRVETYYEIWVVWPDSNQAVRLAHDADFTTYHSAFEWCARYAPSYTPIYIIKRQTTWEIAKDE